MNHLPVRSQNGFIQQWAVVDNNTVEWFLSFEEAANEHPIAHKLGVMQNDAVSPVIIMSNADTITLYDTELNEAVLLFHNLLCDRETARE